MMFQVLESDMSNQVKALAIKKIKTLDSLDPSNSEYHKLKTWIDGLLAIPFGKYEEDVVKASDSKNKIRKYLDNAKNVLDEAVYGHEDAKKQILHIIAQRVSNP